MQALAAIPSMFAGLVGGWEMVVIVAVILTLVGAKKLPEIIRGLGEGVSQFRKSLGGLSKELDQDAHDAGESLGGIYGKSVAQALTPDNQTAELYDPDVFHNQERTGLAPKRMRFRGWSRLWLLIWRLVSRRRNPKL
jgi:sec-independent protein translocase protein TatA